jgi:hypothetical protein
VTVEKLRQGVVKAVNHFRQSKIGGTLQLIAPTHLQNVADDAVAETMAQSALLSNYKYDKYISKPSVQNLDEIVLAGVSETFRDPLKDIKTLCGRPFCRYCFIVL